MSKHEHDTAERQTTHAVAPGRMGLKGMFVGGAYISTRWRKRKSEGATPRKRNAEVRRPGSGRS